MNAKASVAVLTVLLLAACGGQSAPASQSAAAKPASSSPAAAPSGTSGSAGASPQASGAAAAGWDDLVAAAKKEGALSLYGTPGTPYRQVSVVEFEKAFPGIKVDGAFIPPTDQQSRLNLERQAGKYLADVTQAPGGSQLVAYREAKWMAPLAPNFVLPEVTDTSKWFQNQLPWVDSGEPHLWLSPVGSVIPIVFVNKSVDASQFTSYKDLLDPKWKGKLASTDIRNPGPGVAPSRFIRKSPDLGPSFVKQLFAPGAVKLSTDQRQLIDWVAQGTYPVGLFLDPGEVAIAIKQGLPITMVPPEQFKEGAAIGPNNAGVAVFDRAPHPNAAKLYVNWILSREGQTIWQREVGDNSLRTDIPKDGVNPAFVTKPGVNYTNVGVEDIVNQFPTSQLKDLISN
ncbi:MAG TPA: extracellular solute-binding protein [Chloroflexota bacterium]|nr:extracellular solute-binding protein [Chloroflexota bacterium]